MFKHRNEVIELEPTKELTRVAIRLNNKKISKQLVLNDRSALENFVAIPQQVQKLTKNTQVDLNTYEMGFSSNNELIDAQTNTLFTNKKNSLVQTEYEYKSIDLSSSVESLKKFIYESKKNIEEVIAINECIEIFEDDVLPGISSNKAIHIKEQDHQINIKELKCFEHESCKQKFVSSILYQQGSDLVAILLKSNFNFDESINLKCKSFNSYIAIWNMNEFHRFSPIALLVVPVEPSCMCFKNDDRTTLIVGCENGQLFIYDLLDIETSFSLDQTVRMEHDKNKLSSLSWRDLKITHRILAEKNNLKTSLSHDSSAVKEQNDILYIKPLISSHLLEPNSATQNLTQLEVFSKKNFHFSSHRSPVKSINFLPDGVSLDKKNPFSVQSNESGKPYHSDQFITVSEDGQILFWDLNLNDKKDYKTGEIDLSKIVFKAFLSLQLFKPDQSVYNVKCVSLSVLQGTTVLMGTDDGDLISASYNAKECFKEDSSKYDIIKGTWNSNSKLTIINIQQNCQIPNLILAANEISFQLYFKEVAFPIFTSTPISNTKISCVKFSPTRASIIFVGREDGMLDIWDLNDQTEISSQQHLISATGISSIEFHSSKSHLMVIGDRDGAVHLLYLPQTYYKVYKSEEKFFESFINNSVNKYHYYKKEYESLEQENNNDKINRQNDEENQRLKNDDNRTYQDKGNRTEEEIMEEAYKKFIEEQTAKLQPSEELTS